MTQTIRLATAQDVPSMAEVVFAGDQLHAAMFPRINQDSYSDWYRQKLRKHLVDPAVRTILAMEGDAVIANAQWQVSTTCSPSNGPQVHSETEVGDGVEAHPLPHLTNQALVNYSTGRVDRYASDTMMPVVTLSSMCLPNVPGINGGGGQALASIWF